MAGLAQSECSPHGAATDPFAITRNPWMAAKSAAANRRGAPPKPPGPPGRPFIGVFPEWQSDPFTYLQGLTREYGDVVNVPIPFYNVVLLNHPDHVAQVMNNKDGGYSMVGAGGRLINGVFGSSVATLEGDAFRHRRRLLAPMFGRSNLVAIGDVVAAEFADRLDRWEQHVDTVAVIDLQQEIAHVTMPAFVKAMFSVEISEERIEQLDEDLRLMMRFVSGLVGLNRLPGLVPVLPGQRATVLQGHARIKSWIDDLIDARLESGDEYQDLLQVMLDARYEDGRPISRKDLGMEMLILTAGGYETVVASLCWTLALLDSNKPAQQRLYDEVDELGGKVPSFDDLDRLQWAKACFDEGQRLQGHPFHPRFAMRDDVIGDYRIPKGTLVGVSMYALHRDPRWWGPDPDCYDPNHFFDKAEAEARPNLAFIPFGAGPHRCIGSALAYMNAAFLLAVIHQRYRIQLQPGWVPRHASTFSCTIRGGLPVTLNRAPGRAGCPR